MRGQNVLAATVVGLASLVNAAPAASASCVTTTYASVVPTATAVALRSLAYCGGTLYADAYIENLCYNKVVSLYYTDKSGASTPLSAVNLGYQSSISNTNYELWSSTTPYVNLDGISNLLNLTYNAVDINQIFVQNLSNITVNASGPKPTSTSIPPPYATPTGFSKDITNFLAAAKGSEAAKAKRFMFNNIEVTDAAVGTIVAAQSYANPDYGYNWVRDSSLTFDVVASLYAGASNMTIKNYYSDLLFNYSIARATEQIDPGLQTGLGEPKFNLGYVDNSVFTGPWGRPQNDGPATAAITLMEFANTYLTNGGSLDTVKNKLYNSSANPSVAPIMKDLLFVASNWSSPSFDLWEEEESDHFYTRMVQHRALVLGSTFATKMGDSATSTTLSSAATALVATMSQFWDNTRNLILYEYGPVLNGKYSFKDAAVILGVLHGYAGDGLYSYTDPKVLSSALEITTSFLIYNISSVTHDTQGRILGIPIGRYPEDVYNGTGTQENGGNPWYLCTAAMAELFYRASASYTATGKISVTGNSLAFWRYFSPQANVQAGKSYPANDVQFFNMVNSLNGWGDAFMRTVNYYTPPSGRMPEEINRNTGAPQGARDLTWSYASVVTAGAARAAAMNNNEATWWRSLADIPVTTNSTGVGANRALAVAADLAAAGDS